MESGSKYVKIITKYMFRKKNQLNRMNFDDLCLLSYHQPKNLIKLETY